MPFISPYASRHRLIPVCVLALSMLMFLSSCSSTRTGSMDDVGDGVYFTDEIFVPLMPYNRMAGSIDELQRISARFGDKEQSMNAFLMADNTGIRMIGMGDMGQELFYLEYDSEGLHMSGIAVAMGMNPSYIVMDLQLVYYPSDFIRTYLDSFSLEFDESQRDNMLARSVRNGNEVIADISISRESIKLENRLRGYEYSILREPDNE